MERSLPENTRQRLEQEQVRQYARRARMDVLADFYFRGNVDDRLDLRRFVQPEEIQVAPAEKKQAWLDAELARRIAQATREWEAVNDDVQWRRDQEQISNWYQCGLVVMDLLTEDDMAVFIQAIHDDPSERLRHQTVGDDSMRIVQPSGEVGSNDSYSADFYRRAHP